MIRNSARNETKLVSVFMQLLKQTKMPMISKESDDCCLLTPFPAETELFTL